MASSRAIEAGKAIIRVSLNSDAVDRGLRDIESRARATSSVLSSMGTALLASGAALGGMMVMPLKYAANLQQVGVAYEVLTGSAAKAAGLMAEIKTMAASTPFGFKDLADGGRVLMGYGLQSEAVIKTMGMLGDVSGGNVDRFQRLSLAYGQVIAKGKLMGTENLQLIEAGFNPLSEIARTTGRSMADLSKAMESGEISSAMLSEAFRTATSEGGMFFRMMEKQSQTFMGKLSTLTDNARDSLLSLGTELMAVLGPAMDSVSQMITSLGSTLATTEGLAASWLTAAVSAAGLGLALLATAKAIAAVNVVMTVSRAIVTTIGVAYTLLKVSLMAATAAWVAIQVTIHAVTASIVLATIAVRTFGAATVASAIATRVWAATVTAARIAYSLLTNAVTLGKVAFGGYLAITSAVSLAQSVLTGRLIAGYLATRGMLIGSGLVASAFGAQAVATATLSASQWLATTASGLLTGALGMGTAASGVSAAAAGGLAGVWAMASGVIASAYAVITSPLIPLYLAITAVVAGIAVIAGVAAAAAVSAGVLSDAWTYATESLGGILLVVKQVAAGLKAALAAGQYVTAAKILWAGIQQLFWMGVRASIQAVRTLPGYMWDILKQITTRTISTLWNLFKGIPSLLMAALRGESLGDAIKAVIGTGDWLEGLATDRIIEARNEMRGLADDVRGVAAAQKLANDQLAEMKDLGLIKGDDGEIQGGPAAPEKTGQQKLDEYIATGRTSEEVAQFKARQQSIEIAKRDRAAAESARQSSNTAAVASGGETVGDLSAIQKRMAALRNETLELERGADAAEDARLAEKARADGLSGETIDAELAALKTMRERKRLLEEEKAATEKASDAIVKKIDSQASELAERGMSADEIYKRQIQAIDANVAAGNVTDEDGDRAKERAADDREGRLKSRVDEGKRLADELRTPLEKFNDEAARIQGLRASGDIDSDTAARAMARNREDLATAQKKELNSDTPQPPPELGTALLGSKEASDTLARTRAASSGDQIAGPRLPPEMRAQIEAANRQVAATEQLPAKFAEAVNARITVAINTKKLEELAAKSLDVQQRLPTLLQTIAVNTRPGGESL